jgi:hypothetical protein
MGGSVTGLVLVAVLCAGAAAVFLWVSAREQARRDSHLILKALQSSHALLSAELEPLLSDGQVLLDQASITKGAAATLLNAVSEYRARVAVAQLHLRNEADADSKWLAEAGIDLHEAMEALTRASTAVQDFYAMASRSGEGQVSEMLHASARCASARISELGQQVHQLQSSIHQKEAALGRLAA